MRQTVTRRSCTSTRAVDATGSRTTRPPLGSADKCRLRPPRRHHPYRRCCHPHRLLPRLRFRSIRPRPRHRLRPLRRRPLRRSIRLRRSRLSRPSPLRSIRLRHLGLPCLRSRCRPAPRPAVPPSRLSSIRQRYRRLRRHRRSCFPRSRPRRFQRSALSHRGCRPCPTCRCTRAKTRSTQGYSLSPASCS